MFLRLLLLFIIVPFVELMLLVWLAQRTGFGVTLAIVLSTGLIGAFLARREGLKAWNAIRADLAATRLPANSVINGLLVLVASLFLLTPGLITDTAGFLLLIPPVRQVVALWLMQRFKRNVELRVRGFTARRANPGGGEVIDAEFRRVDGTNLDSSQHVPR